MTNFMKYSNENQVNIIQKEAFEDLVKEVFSVISENITRSLGPLGSSATILDGMNTSATKDGYQILKSYNFTNRYKRMIYNLIMAPCTAMNNTVGDGTTTAIDLTDALFREYTISKGLFETLYRLPRQFTSAWDEVINEIIDRVKSKSIQIDSSDYDTIYNIAYVVSNGNKEISENIAKVYSEVTNPTIRQKDSPTNKSYISRINGYDFPTNMITDAYVRNEDLTAEEKDVFVMIFDHKIETDVFKTLIAPINDVCRAMGKKVIVVAPFYDAYMCDTVLDQYIKYEFRQYGSINLVMTQYSSGDIKNDQLKEFSVITRSKIITQDLEKGIIESLSTSSPDTFVDKVVNSDQFEFNGIIGCADTVMLSCNRGSVFKVKDIDEYERYTEMLNRAKQDLIDIKAETSKEKQAYANKIYELTSKITRLEMNTYNYFIGADSVLQKNIIWDSVEDVIKCVRSAVKSGVVPGCQLTIIKSCEELMKEIIPDVQDKNAFVNLSNEQKLKYQIIFTVYSSVIKVYYHVLHGADGTGMVKLIDGWQHTKSEDKESLYQKAMDKSEEIVKESIERNQVFDMDKLEFSSNIITSAETDIMVLSAASELVKILISGNQCIYLDAELNNREDKTVEAYV